jgi:hypothetical protein
MSPEIFELVKSALPFVVTVVINAITMFVSQARSEERMKAEIQALKTENVGFRETLKVLGFEKAHDRDLQDFKARQKEHDVTLWTKLDSMREDIGECLRKLSRVEALQEVQQRSK